MISVTHYGANCIRVQADNASIYFSYQTVVAIATENFRFRADHFYSTTTSRHMNKMGVSNYTPIPLTDFKELVESISINVLPTDKGNTNG
jgi:hypothetical protein